VRDLEDQRVARDVHIAGGMKLQKTDSSGEGGKIGWILAWLIGIPLPVLLIVYLFSRGC
jgi:hypothetical protein